MKRQVFTLLTTISLILTAAFAQAQQKHPRVVELEAHLTAQAMEMMRSRFPDKPFLVTVALDPLHRETAATPQTGQGESQAMLPFSWQEDDEIRDEWDDPNIPLGGLITRVKKAVVTVSVPSETTDDEIAEVQQSLFASLNLFQARDDVKVQRRNWSQKPTQIEPIFFKVIGGAILMLIVGVAIIFFLAARRISKAIGVLSEKGVAANASAGAAGAAAAPMARPMSSESSEGRKGGIGPAADVRFNDPLKTREVILNTINLLMSQQRTVFPSLKDMMQLDRFGEANPGGLGALVLELPLDQQKALFGRSFAKHWLDALNEPGDLSPACLDMLQKLVRGGSSNIDPKWEELLIAFWRLDSIRPMFIRSLDQEEAFAILARMPKSLAVSVARAAFPGSWGVLLDANFKARDLTPDRLDALTEKAYSLVPLREPAVLERYKQEKEFLDYLHTVEPSEEREIYLATPSDSLIHTMRAPFYPVLSLPSDDMKAVANSVALEDWALAMLNVPKPERRGLEQALTDKQRFMFFEILRQLDSASPSPHQIGEARQRVAQCVDRHLKNKPQPVQATEPEQGKDSVELQSAA